jgi:hypothetical protein
MMALVVMKDVSTVMAAKVDRKRRLLLLHSASPEEIVSQAALPLRRMTVPREG